MNRVAISTPFVGGAGGCERAVYAIAHVLDDCRIDIYTRRNAGGPLADLPTTTRVRGRWWWRELGPRFPLNRWVNTILRIVRRAATPRYDLHLHYMAGPAIVKTVRATLHGVVPAGLNVSKDFLRHYDVALLEAPANRSLLPDDVPAVLFPPPVIPLALEECAVSEVPEEFFLTVMNPHSPAKGGDILWRTAHRSRLPIVWCYSEQSVAASHPGEGRLPSTVIPVVDATPAELNWLYRRCAGYVCFSRSEGFGWAIADAIAVGAPVLSRATGVLTIPEIAASNVHLYSSEEELAAVLAHWHPHRIEQPVDVYNEFRDRVGRLLRGQIVPTFNASS